MSLSSALLQADFLALTDEYCIDMPLMDLLSVFEKGPVCISIKDQNGLYRHANKNFSRLMGHLSGKTILGRKDAELTNNRQLLKTIRRHDEQLFDEAKSFQVNEILHPLATPAYQREVKGTLYPVFTKNRETHCAILGVFQPVNKLLYLSVDVITHLSLPSIQSLLINKSYAVTFNNLSFSLSRQEIMVITGMVKGMNAQEIAAALALQQTTVEGYSQNIKNKLGVSRKSEIIAAALEGRLLEEILI
ncbi:LuxR C-terminal-related transcriptional regulator [Legionella sp. CNM-4043-24]|uniref:LuxR C-terminal-related transcriptional regulator n=1 Tax=Legionella sp. CNM-4043-24 TaxID=3421646 RepID=UPI00403AAFB2